MAFHWTGRRAQAGSQASVLWGDGFSEDRLRDLYAVSGWDLCSTDEYILLFPRLMPMQGTLPQVLVTHLESCVAARAQRIMRLDPQGVAPALRSCLPGAVMNRADDRDWFPADRPLDGWMRRFGLRPAASVDRDAERSLLTFLDGVLFDVQHHRVTVWSDDAEALLPFGAGFHPAYLWPQAGVSHARGTTAGWLGHLSRGRVALMPPVVAEYLDEAFGGSEADWDLRLVAMAGGRANVCRLLEAGRRRLAGRAPSVRLPPSPASLAGWLSNPALQTGSSGGHA